MDNIDLSLLNNAQLTALNEINGAIMVLAGAGSGKTRLVTYRIAYLIKNLGVNPHNILAITFTNKATNEMRERLFTLLGDDAQDIWISTFHSMCVKILRKHISSLKSSKNLNHTANFDSNFSIYTDTEKERAIKTVIENLGIKIDNFASKVSYHISNAKNKNLLEPVNSLTLSTLESIANDPKDPRQKQAEREVERRKKTMDQRKTSVKDSSKADQSRKDFDRKAKQQVRQQQQQQKSIKNRSISKKRNKAGLNLMKSPSA